MLPHLIFVVYALLVGLVVGSYLNVVVHRLPRGISTIRPRSACPRCGAPIRARDNLPLVSFLLLRGRCRSCGAPISRRYPLVEAATALLFVACLERFGPSPQAVAAAIFCALLVALAAIDLEHLLLPDRLTLPAIVAGLGLQAWLPPSFVDALIGALGGAGLLFLLAEGWAAARGEEGMGLGDAKLLAAIGAFLGWQGAALALFFGSLAGGVTGLALVATGRAGLKSRLPFGAFLALGGLVALFAGDLLLAAYRGLL